MTNRRDALYALALLCAINTMNFYDRMILAALAEPIRKEWHLSDTALGWLGTAFILLYACFGLPLGMLADKASRKWILAAGVFAWSLLTGISGLCQSFWQLFVVRLGVGLGEATCAPAASSVIGDYFTAQGRARAMSVFMFGLPIGNALALISGGWIAKHYHWRSALFVACIPGLILAVMALWMKEPIRGATATHDIGQRRRPGSPVLLVLSIPTMMWIIISGALHNFNMYAFGQFVNPLLQRFHHVEEAQAGLLSGLAFGLAGLPGLILGGLLGDAMARRHIINGRLLLGAIAITASVPLIFLGLRMPAGSVLAFSLFMAGGCGLWYVYYSTVYSTIHDVIEPGLRGTAMALYFFAMYLLGALWGPVGTGAASDFFTRRAALADGVSLEGLTSVAYQAALAPYRATGLQSAMYIVPVLCTILSVVLFAASRTVKRDAEKLEAWMREASPSATPTPEEQAAVARE